MIGWGYDMRTEEFRSWLHKNKTNDRHQISDIISRVNRVEKTYSMLQKRTVNLDEEYRADKCAQILALLCKEERSKIQEDINLPHSTAGLSQLRTALRNYIYFCDSESVKNK